MRGISIRSTLAAGLIVSTGLLSVALGAGLRLSSLDRYGIGGHIQPIGVHHGFHIETVAADSAAFDDHLKPHDVIVKIDGDVIRSLDHLRAVMAEAYIADDEVTIVYQRGPSLTQHVLKTGLKQDIKPVAKKRRSDAEDGVAR